MPLHVNNVYANTPQYDVMCKLPIFLNQHLLYFLTCAFHCVYHQYSVNWWVCPIINYQIYGDFIT